MAVLRTDDTGLDVTLGSIRSYSILVPTQRNPSTIVGDFRLAGIAGYTVRIDGSGLGGSDHLGLGSGTVTGLREDLFGFVNRFTITGANVPAQAFLDAIRSNNDAPAISVLLGGDDVVQGGGGNDTLAAYGGRNTISGGGGNDTAVIGADRTATLAYRYRNEAVVLRIADRQADLLIDVETVRFRDGTALPTTALTAAQPYQYLATYRDLAAAFRTDEVAAWRHFAQAGLAEGRAVGFSGLSYIASYGDLRAVYRTDAEAGARHFLTNGRTEGRTVAFDGLRYIASHGDLVRALPKTIDAGAMHFIAFGANELRTVTFDPLRYIASHRDLIRAYGANEARGTQHYLASGFVEARPTAAFNPTKYLANYADLRAAFGTDLRAATLHFIQNGAAENRLFTPLA